MVDIDIADVLSSEVEGGEVRVDLGDNRDGETLTEGAQYWGVDGFYSMPATPDEAGCAQALFMVDGNARRCIGSRDMRTVNKYGSLQPGDRAIISTGDARFVLKNEANSLTMYTEMGPEGDRNAVMVDIRGDSAGGTVIIKCGAGAFTMKQPAPGVPAEITIGNGLGGISIDSAGGVKINGTSLRLSGGIVLIGGLSGEAPLPGVNSALVGATGVTGVPSTSVFIGV